ncbi:MAG: hypothetical protein AB1715_11780, partial [Acidobacteriota bacterium]
ETRTDESLFQTRSVTQVAWSNNPANDALGVQIVLYRIYRKKSGESDTLYRLCGEATAGAYKFLDTDVDKEESYVYTVTAVDSQGHESPIIAGQSTSLAFEKPRASPSALKRGKLTDKF